MGKAVVTFSTLFPSAVLPHAGLFIRERMFRVAKHMPLTVVSPVPWFPFQNLLRRVRPHTRAMPPMKEEQGGTEVLHPRFFSVPGAFKSWDGLLLALGSYSALRRLKREGRLDILDAHFAYPDGYAATLLGRWLDVPVTITLRGTEIRQSKDARFRRLIARALGDASRIFCVARALKQLALSLGVPGEKISVISNGVDLAKFFPMAKNEARDLLGIPLDAKVLVTVGALVERKGFHRVIGCLHDIRSRAGEILYLVVGGSSPEGDIGAELREQAGRLGLHDCVRFLGPLPADQLRLPLSAADLFVLSTRNEGWANVLLEAMACGLPVVTTDVGGNAEVVCHSGLGTIVPFGDQTALADAIGAALLKPWDKNLIIGYARANEWTSRVETLVSEFEGLLAAQRKDKLARAC